MAVWKIKPRVFNRVYRRALKLQTPVQIFYGGSSSGKSYFLAQRCVLDVVRYGRNYLCVRNTANTLRGSLFNEIRGAIRFFKLTEFFNINLSDMVITCKRNGAQIYFRGLNDPERLKSVRPESGVITDIWMEEATECSQDAFTQLVLRLRGRARIPKRIILSFNPIYRSHWIFKEFFNGVTPRLGEYTFPSARVCILRTFHKHNAWLDDEDHERIYDFKNKNPYAYDVYGLGKWGLLSGVIFQNNWRTEDLSDIKETFNAYRNGMDFGYSDPAALVRCARKENEIYVLDGIYTPQLTNPALAKLAHPIVHREPVWCDCAEPKSIAEVREQGEYSLNAKAVKKGRDSVWHGIQWLLQYTLVVDRSLQGLINELSTYSWKKDKWGESTGVPEDRNNHAIDALRYAWESDMDLRGKPLMVTTARNVDGSKRETGIPTANRIIKEVFE